MRLQKYLAECGVASRRKCEDIVRAGRVCINGKPATLGESIDPNNDTVTLDDQPVTPDTKCYIVLNKPPDVLTTAVDTHGRKTVFDCISGLTTRVVPVGRLDLDVTGTLLLTNDGELAHRLMHPRYEIDKTYEAEVEGRMTEATAEKLSRGVDLEDGPTATARVSVLDSNENTTTVQLTVHEGRKRLIKRMCAAVGHPVRRLKRLSIAGISAADLALGDWRRLNEEEIVKLKELTRLNKEG